MSNIIHNLPSNSTLAKAIIESFENAAKTCSTPSVFYTAEKLPGTDITFHDLLTILSSVPTVLCCLISMYIITGHYLHWVNPKEQKQIVLCISYLPIFCVINFFAGWFYAAYNVIIPVLSLYTAKGLVAVFLLYVAYICPDEAGRETFHVGLERRGYHSRTKHNRGSLRWFRVIWVLVFQIVPVTICLFPIQYIVLHVICPLDSRLESAEMALAGIQFATTSISWGGIYVYFKRTQSQLKKHRGSRKLNSFQSLVGLQAIQSLVFPLVTQASSYYPTKYVSYQDFSNAIPAFMTCWESLIFSCLFIQVFSFTSYRNAVLRDHVQPATVWRAVLDTVNQMDIVKGVVYMFQIIFQRADKADSRMFRPGSKDGDPHELELQLSDGAHELLHKLNSEEP